MSEPLSASDVVIKQLMSRTAYYLYERIGLRENLVSRCVNGIFGEDLCLRLYGKRRLLSGWVKRTVREIKEQGKQERATHGKR